MVDSEQAPLGVATQPAAPRPRGMHHQRSGVGDRAGDRVFDPAVCPPVAVETGQINGVVVGKEEPLAVVQNRRKRKRRLRLRGLAAPNYVRQLRAPGQGGGGRGVRSAQKRRRQNPPPLRCRHRRSTPLGRLAPSLLHDIPRRARPRPSAPSRLSRPGAAPHGSTRAVFAETTGSRRARLRFPRSTPPRARLRRAWVYYALGHPLARFASHVIFAF